MSSRMRTKISFPDPLAVLTCSFYCSLSVRVMRNMSLMCILGELLILMEQIERNIWDALLPSALLPPPSSLLPRDLPLDELYWHSTPHSSAHSTAHSIVAHFIAHSTTPSTAILLAFYSSLFC